MAKAESVKHPVMPVGDAILVQLATSTKSPTGILLPNEEVKYGTILALGKGVPENVLRTKDGENGLAVGDKVSIPHVKKAQFTNEAGDSFVVIPSSHINAVLL